MIHLLFSRMINTEDLQGSSNFQLEDNIELLLPLWFGIGVLKLILLDKRALVSQLSHQAYFHEYFVFNCEF